MASEKKEKVEIKTHEIPGPRDFWKTWRRGKPGKIVSNPQDIPADEWLSSVEPPEIRDQVKKDAQLEAGVGSFVSRTAAGMDKIKERAEKVGEEAEKRRVEGSSSESSETSES